MDNSLSKEATDWREGRRLRAFELKQEGCSQQRIAEALGVSKGAVSQWMKRAREGGIQALQRSSKRLNHCEIPTVLEEATGVPNANRRDRHAQSLDQRFAGSSLYLSQNALDL